VILQRHRPPDGTTESAKVRRERRDSLERELDGESDLDLDPEISVGALVREAYIRFRRELRSKYKSKNVTSAQWVFLRHLWRNDGVTQVELSTSLGLHPSTTVDALRVLERNGYVRRVRDGRDGRAIRVNLTKAGWKLRDFLIPQAIRINEDALRDFTPEETATLCRLLLRVRSNLDRGKS
jgi:DNA-binding MarR family transcriptional regulator